MRTGNSEMTICSRLAPQGKRFNRCSEHTRKVEDKILVSKEEPWPFGNTLMVGLSRRRGRGSSLFEFRMPLHMPGKGVAQKFGITMNRREDSDRDQPPCSSTLGATRP